MSSSVPIRAQSRCVATAKAAGIPGQITAHSGRWPSNYKSGVNDSKMPQSDSFDIEFAMNQITARLPDAVLSALDEAAVQLRRSRADVIRQAIERYLEDFDDLTSAVERLRDPTDPVLDWERVRHELLDSD